MIEIFFALLCMGGVCHPEYMTLSREAAAVASCESGDTVTLGSLNWNAVNTNTDGTIDTGAFQFNGYWIWSSDDRWMMRRIAQRLAMSSDAVLSAWPRAGDAPPAVQIAAFEVVWDDGRGWRHWAASRPCWEKWINIEEIEQ